MDDEKKIGYKAIDQNKLFCTQCGNEMPLDAKYCTRCGKLIKQNDQ